MNYFIAEGTFHDPIPVDKSTFEEIIPRHLSFIEKGHSEKIILISGAKPALNGGVLVMKAGSPEEAEAYLSNDPMVLAGVLQYRLVEFNPHGYPDAVGDWFKS